MTQNKFVAADYVVFILVLLISAAIGIFYGCLTKPGSVGQQPVVEEETFLEWAKKGSKKFVSRDENKEVQAKAAPFIKWLAEAETESDEDDDDDEDAVEFESQQSPVKANGAPPKISARKAAATNGNDDADDIDIDDI